MYDALKQNQYNKNENESVKRLHCSVQTGACQHGYKKNGDQILVKIKKLSVSKCLLDDQQGSSSFFLSVFCHQEFESLSGKFLSLCYKILINFFKSSC